MTQWMGDDDGLKFIFIFSKITINKILQLHQNIKEFVGLFFVVESI